MSKKNYRYNKDVKWTLEDAIKFFQKPKGRIKRMKSLIPKHRWPSIYKRIGRKRYVTILRMMDDDVFEKTMFGITRWNKH